ncbi:response regulator [Reyranella sp. MMS21-HV4-11]|uniref:histidine kinase n=1 Tax=Reyranella humidisoli TaxID=2849149 RepID=A0ABS6IR50_9HYPH|nr:ATP-binding protein [Reyranella sp. MMS21-HV4-11]MBU8875655.1 response regulator [Reyranella sp. MMS21-HV4-11]
MRTLRGWIARAVVGGRRWRNSFRVRLLVLGLITITGTAITLTYTQSIQMREALLVELHARARTDGQLLNAMFAAPLIERDYASVVDSVSESVRAGSFEALLLCDSRGMLIAAAGPLSDCNGPSVPFKGLPLPQADGTVLQLFEVALSFGHQRLGLARFAFSLAAVDQIRRELMTRVIVISSLAIAAFMLAFAIAQSQVTRPLNQLVRAAEAIGQGDYSVRPRITSRTSELTILASAISRMATDIEERVTELALARDAATASDRAKSLFLANMSHEVRTPLAGVLGMLELAKPGITDPAVRKYLDTAEHAARHLLTIVNDILDFAQLEKGRLAVTSTPFSVRALVESTIPLVAAAAEERGNRMEVRIADDVPRQILGDEGRLRQVLLNLLSNAVKFTSQGTVSVEARTVDAGHRLLLTVADTGIGMAPEMQQRIFESFVQADESIARRFGGTGLGLPICRQLLALMGGSISVESSPGRGSLFTVDLPCRPVVDTVPATASRATDRPPAARRILVADDAPTMRILLEALLTREGHTCDLVEDGNEAVAAVRASDYDAVLMDVQMPRLDGLEATRKIRKEEGPRSRVPIVFVTASAMAGDEERFLAAGGDGYVSKPITPETLRAVLAKALARR